ncbi:unnamed protein product [Protopolystoma xenopodis]|uniref:Alpha-D-phosphohexomutase alpha/beta/alpha domain-containing protein n=1 Tax=Protopolystoma xenopodis TaxID=117903 RepID=A0A3S5ADE2_9PLAT|nr:unnamed protein product [Protopolystoma xenopodis]
MSTEKYEILIRDTKPFDGQKPGTSGLRKPTRTFLEPNYTENCVQAILTAGADAPGRASRGLSTKLVLGGDGRYFSDVALRDIIIPMCAANGVRMFIIEFLLLSLI